MKNTSILRTEFSCAHFYRIDSWSDEQNLAEFGKCFSQYGHGHDYILQVECLSSDLEKTRNSLQALQEKLDHRHLNFTIDEFRLKVPTSENFALFIQDNLQTQNLGIVSLKLYERSDLWVEILI